MQSREVFGTTLGQLWDKHGLIINILTNFFGKVLGQSWDKVGTRLGEVGKKNIKKHFVKPIHFFTFAMNFKTYNMNTIESNKQIAKFLGLTHKATKCGFIIKGIVVKYEKLNFHNDWNSLMEVVEKIESLGCSISISSGKSQFVIINFERELCFFSAYLDNNTKIEAVYNACVKFIKWYNEQEPQLECLKKLIEFVKEK